MAELKLEVYDHILFTNTTPWAFEEVAFNDFGAFNVTATFRNVYFDWVHMIDNLTVSSLFQVCLAVNLCTHSL